MSGETFVALLLLAWLLCAVTVVGVLWRCASSPYPPEAAEAPDDGFERARPLTEVGPFVVAGSDLDRAHQPMAVVDLTLRLMVDADPELAAMNAKAETLAGLYVAPEVDR